jgi:hypothetical protein
MPSHLSLQGVEHLLVLLLLVLLRVLLWIWHAAAASAAICSLLSQMSLAHTLPPMHESAAAVRLCHACA